MPELLTASGVAAAVSAIVSWAFHAFVDQRLKERLARVEAQLDVQTRWLSARLTRTDERRARALSRLHTRLDTALRFTEQYVGSHDAGNTDAHVDELRTSSVLAWIAFDRSFSRAEIFLSEQIANRIRTYGDAIADVRVAFESKRRGVDPEADFATRLRSVSEALEKLGRLETDVRPQLVKEIRAALGADAIDVEARPRAR
jgi:hypothetical protein